MQYSEKVMDHFRNPRNVGEIPDADGVGEIGNPVCGDVMAFYIKVKDNRIKDVKFKTFGCGAAIAVSSMVSEMAKGKTLDEAFKITRQSIAHELDGLPPKKMHCSNLGADALHKAIEDYLNKGKKKPQEITADKYRRTEKPVSTPGKCICPTCKEKLSELPLYCQPCNKKFNPCPKCAEPVVEGAKKCPHCGVAI